MMVSSFLRDCQLHTVCQEDHCLNLGECFYRETATFMILEDRCTRNCSFCSDIRDDLPDGGAFHFAKTIRFLRVRMPDTQVEILVPDFQGSEWPLKVVMEVRPVVINDNIETVPKH